MSDEELKKYYESYTDCWKFFKKHCQVSSDEEWQQLLIEAKEVCDKDKDSKFRRKLMSETIAEIDRLCKKNKEQ